MADQAAFGFRNFVSKEVTWLTFEMSSTDLARRWALCVYRETRKKGLQIEAVGGLFVDEVGVRTRLGQLCMKLLEARPELRWPRSFAPYIDKSVLNSLLTSCQELMARPSESFGVRSSARELAMWIRRYLTIYQTDVHFHLSLQRELPWLVALQADDFKLFEADRRDGWLYLEYPTLGVSSIAAYQLESTVDLEPQRMFSSNCEIVYREDFEWGPKIVGLRQWVAKALETSPEDPRLAIGMIPLGRPTHGLTRAQVRELASSSEPEVLFCYESEGQVLRAIDIKRLRSAGRRSSLAEIAAMIWANRLQLRKARFGLIRFWGERWRVRLFFLNLFNRFYYRGLLQLYYASIAAYHASVMVFHRWRPVVVEWAHRMTWPVRKPYYFISYQYKKRILKRL